MIYISYWVNGEKHYAFGEIEPITKKPNWIDWGFTSIEQMEKSEFFK